jgi:hypothetical protein
MAIEVEVRYGNLRLKETTGDGLAHAAHGDIGVRLDAFAVRRWSYGHIERTRRGSGNRS